MRIALPRNPVLGRELRERLRRRRATVIVTVYLLILALVLWLLYENASGRPTDFFSGPAASETARLGRQMFETLLLFMLGLVAFIVPGLTADAIAGERERQTLAPLQVTLLRPRSIVLGKLAASVAFATLLVVATLPLLSVSLLIGGVTIGDVARGTAAVVFTAIVLATVSLGCSALARRTQAAVVLSYGLTLLLLLGTALAYGAVRMIDERDGITNESAARLSVAILTLNPVVGSADLAGTENTFDAPLSGLRQGVRLDIAERDGVFIGQRGGVFLEGDVGVGFEGPIPPNFIGDGIAVQGQFEEPEEEHLLGLPFWSVSALVLTWLALTSLVIATRRLRTPSKMGGA